MEQNEIRVPPITITVPVNPPPGDSGFALAVAEDPDDGCVRIYVGADLVAYVTPQGEFKVKLSPNREIVYTEQV